MFYFCVIFVSMEGIELFYKLHNVWLSYAKKITSNDPNAEDLVQDTYIKLIGIGCLDRFIKNGKVNRSWMYITMRNQFLDEKRKEIGRSELVDMPDETEPYDIERDEKINFILDAIKKLNANEATSFHCKYLMLYVLSGKSFNKLAKELGTSRMIIINAINNAKRRIREENLTSFDNNGINQ